MAQALAAAAFVLSMINYLDVAGSLGLQRQSTGLAALVLATASFFVARKQGSIIVSALLVAIGVVDTEPSLAFFVEALPYVSGAIIGVAIGSWIVALGLLKTRTTWKAMRESAAAPLACPPAAGKALIAARAWYPGAFFLHPWVSSFGLAFWVLALLLTALAALLFARWLASPRGRTGSTSGGSGALAILEERYARGEITSEQFAAMKKDIGG